MDKTKGVDGSWSGTNIQLYDNEQPDQENLVGTSGENRIFPAWPYMNRLKMMQVPGLVNLMHLLCDSRTATGFISRQNTVICGSLRPEVGRSCAPMNKSIPQLRLKFLLLSCINSAIAQKHTSDGRLVIAVPVPGSGGETLIKQKIFEK